MERISPDELVLALDEVFYDDPETGPSSIVFDPNFSPTLAPLHEDYQEDAIWLNRNEEESPIWVYLVQKVDLAVSKLGRYGDQDIDDIHTLFDHGLSHRGVQIPCRGGPQVLSRQPRQIDREYHSRYKNVYKVINADVS